MSRFLRFSNIRKVAEALYRTHRGNPPVVRRAISVGLCSRPYGAYTSYRGEFYGHQSYRGGFSRHQSYRDFSVLPLSGTLTHQPLLTWKKLSQKCYSGNNTTFSNIRKVAEALNGTHRGNPPVVRRRPISVGLCSRPYGAYTPYRGGFYGHQSYRGGFYGHQSYRDFSVLPLSGTLTHTAQHTWKKLSQKCYFGGSNFPHINKIAQAMSLALVRSHLIIPGALAFSGSKLAWAQRTYMDTDYIQTENALYTHARQGHAAVTSIVYAFYEGIMLLLRALYLAVLFSPSIIMAPFADSFGMQFRKLWLDVLLGTLEKAGPAFIKWGQWAATRPDLFPKDLCTKLSKLHTKAPEHSFAYTKKTIEKAFGRKLTEIFEHFEEVPVASGSIAQVHRASLRFRYPGQKSKPMLVAVKVRHPGVGDSIRRDFAIINVVAKTSTLIPALKWLRLDESVQQFAVFMMSQVDLAREADNLSRFIYNFRRCKDVSFPKPVYPLVHPAVLVETYELGESVSHYLDDDEGHNRLKSSIAHIGTHAVLKMLLVHNFIHADMHPGNIIVRVPKKKASGKQLFKSKPHVIFLDVGMTAELSKSDQINLLEFFKAVARRDGRTAAESTLRLSRQQKCPNPKAFIAEVEEAFRFWGTPEGDLIHPADCMTELLEMVRRHKVNVDGNVCTVMVTTLVLEGWQRKLDPGYNVMQTLQTLLLEDNVKKYSDLFSRFVDFEV